MHCSQCGHEDPDDAQFCGECGAAQREERREPAPYRPIDSVEGSGDIQPRGLGQLIAATFKVYGKAIVPFFAIALIPQIPYVPVWLSFASDATTLDFGSATEELGGDDPEFNLFTGVVLPLLSLALYVPSAAAAIFCVGQVITGQKVDVITCYSRALGALVELVLTHVLIVSALIASIILMFVIVGIPLFFYLLVVLFFSLQVVVVENRDGISALGRSRHLTLGNWWRLFGIGVVYLLLYIAISIPVAIVGLLLISVSSATYAVVMVVATALVTPISYIGGTLVYIDLRVRKEDYDLQGLVDDLARRPKEARL